MVLSFLTFRLYCLGRKSLVWENELYNTLEYTAPRAWLHTFEADSCMAAFNFADGEEAKNFQLVVQDTLTNKRQKRMGKNILMKIFENFCLSFKNPLVYYYFYSKIIGQKNIF